MTPFEQLRHAIGVLAAPPEEQLLYLVEIGHVDDSRPIDKLTNVDELGLQFEDAAYLAPALLRNAELTVKAGKCIEELNDFMSRVSGTENRAFWTIHALNEDSRWHQIRVMAQDCLLEMTEKLESRGQ